MIKRVILPWLKANWASGVIPAFLLGALTIPLVQETFTQKGFQLPTSDRAITIHFDIETGTKNRSETKTFTVTFTGEEDLKRNGIVADPKNTQFYGALDDFASMINEENFSAAYDGAAAIGAETGVSDDYITKDQLALLMQQMQAGQSNQDEGGVTVNANFGDLLDQVGASAEQGEEAGLTERKDYDAFKQDLVFEEESVYVLKWQKALEMVGYAVAPPGEPGGRGSYTNYYGEATADRTSDFILDHLPQIMDHVPAGSSPGDIDTTGRTVSGPVRSYMNKLLFDIGNVEEGGRLVYN